MTIKILRILSNTVFSLIMVGSLMVLSLVCSFKINNFNVFASSGGVMAIFGVILAVKHELLLYSTDIEKAVVRKFNVPLIAPGENSEEHEYRGNKTKLIIRDEKIGLFMSIIGTFVWAYGGYI